MILKRLGMSFIFLIVALAILWAILQWTSPRGPMIDMSQRVIQGKTPADENLLRFAIATMVSPQATFVSYQRMVDLIGREVGLKGGPKGSLVQTTRTFSDRRGSFSTIG